MRLRSPRRAGLAVPLLGLLISLMSVMPGLVRPALAANPIVTENQLAGSSGWQLGSLVADDGNGQIKGYGSTTSVAQGQSISFFVTVNPVQTYTIDFYRVGWYAGAGGRLRLHAGPLSGTPQQACRPDATTGLIACNWSSGYTLTIPTDWTSGVYFAVLTNAQGYQNYVIFVVRDGRPAAILYQQSAATDEAYNNYPDDHATGKSLYSFNSYGANTVGGDARAVKVSFDRPYKGNGVGGFLWAEIELVRWLERSGYDVTYSTNVDTHTNGAALRNSKAFLSSGHDEYWSRETFDAVQAARDAGVSLGFLGANEIGWQIRYEASAGGVANRVVVCYRDAAIDPVQGPTSTLIWRNPPLSRPEQSLSSVTYASQLNTNTAYVVSNSSNWVYAGTGFRDGDVVNGIVGYEVDAYMPEFGLPNNGTGRILLSQSPFTDMFNKTGTAHSSLYQVAGGAWVFSAGSISWNWGLDNYDRGVADARIQQTMTNILNAFLAVPALPALQASGVQVGSVSGSSAVINWQTNNLANSRVDYGLTTAYGASVSDANRATVQSLALSSLNINTTYHYKVTSVDASGQTASSTDGTFTTTAAPRNWAWVQGTTAADAGIAGGSYTLTIAAPASGNFLALSSVLVDINVAGTPSIASVRDNGSPASSWARAVANTDTGLKDSGEIWYATNVTGRPTQITVTVNGGGSSNPHQASRVDEYSGIVGTPPLDQTAMRGEYNVTSSPSGTTAATAVDQELALAIYGDNNQGLTITSPAGWTERRNSSGRSGAAEVVVEKAIPIGTQSATFTTNGATWAVGAIATFKIATGPPPPPPPLQVTGVTAGNLAATSAVISWQTNNAANSRVDYGLTTAYGSSVTDGTSATAHSLTLTNLVASTTYHYKVTSVDGTGQTASSVDATFTTGALLQVSAVAAGNLAATSAVITWQTNNAANSRVDYGPTTAYGSSLSDGTSLTAHSVSVTGLTASTTYHYKVTSVDGFGQTASSGDGSFATTAAPPGWAWVQGTTAADAGIGGGSYTLAIAAPASGNFLALSSVLVDVNVAGTPSIASVRDNGNPASTWARAVANTDTGLKDSGEIWYATNVTGRPTQITVTVNGGGSTAPHQASRVDEYSGIVSGAPLDQTAMRGDYNVTSSPTGTTAATTVDQELAVAIYGDNNQGLTITSPAGWTERRNSTGRSGAAEVVIEKAIPIGAQSATFTTSGNTWAVSAIATFKIATGPPPPPPPLQVTGVAAGSLTASSAVISWQTNNAANSRVDYGLTTGYGSPVTDGTSVTAHSVTLTGLTGATTYHYKVTSVDGTGQVASSVDGSFTTSALLQVTGAQAGNVTASSAVISWQTNNAANSRVDYGLTTAYGSTVTVGTSVTAHAVTLTGLTGSTTYHYKVTSVDGSGQTASSTDGSFTTSVPPPGWAWVQGLTGADAAIGGGSYTLPIAAPVGGNFLVLSSVLVDVNNAGTPSIASVRDNGSPASSWARAVANTDTGLRDSGEIWYATNVTGRPTQITVTVNGGGSTNPHQASRVDEYSGIVSATPLDQTAIRGDYNVTASPTGTTAATVVDQELAVAIYGDNNQGLTITSPAGWTERRNSLGRSGAAEVVIDRAIPIGAQSATFTTNGATWAVAAIATFKIATGPPPPLQVSGVAAGNVGVTSAVISWQTNNAANGRVDYGLTTAYGSSMSDATRVTAHALTLTGLTASTTYHYKVTSVDAASQTASSADGTFATSATPRAWAWVQGVTGADAAVGGSSYTLTMAAPNTGNFMALSSVLVDVNKAGTPTIASVSDNGSPASSWSRAVANTDTGLHDSAEIWYATNVTGHPTVITVTVSGGGSTALHQASRIDEYSGIATSAPLDQTATQSDYNVAASPTGTTAATAMDQELALAIYGDNNQGLTVTSPAGWTERRNSVGRSGAAEAVIDRPVPIGPQSAIFATNGNTWAVTAIATFKLQP